ncbi:MAG: hypothetical protein IMZ55_06400 [Acidobacteria bacterium]|nr:hypothetical protein [Acidobacteriota bacterium]
MKRTLGILLAAIAVAAGIGLAQSPTSAPTSRPATVPVPPDAPNKEPAPISMQDVLAAGDQFVKDNERETAAMKSARQEAARGRVEGKRLSFSGNITSVVPSHNVEGQIKEGFRVTVLWKVEAVEAIPETGRGGRRGGTTTRKVLKNSIQVTFTSADLRWSKFVEGTEVSIVPFVAAAQFSVNRHMKDQKRPLEPIGVSASLECTAVVLR